MVTKPNLGLLFAVIEYPVDVLSATTHIVQEWMSANREKQDLLYPDEYMQRKRENEATGSPSKNEYYSKVIF